MRKLDITENHVAWCRFEGQEENRTINTCSSNDVGAFKVFRQSLLDEAYSIGYKHGAADALSGDFVPVKKDCDGTHVDDECKRLDYKNAEWGCSIQDSENLYRFQLERIGFIYVVAESQGEAKKLFSESYPNETIVDIAILTHNVLRA